MNTIIVLDWIRNFELPAMYIYLDFVILFIQVNWLNTDVFYPDFRIYGTDFKAPVPIHLHANFSAY